MNYSLNNSPSPRPSPSKGEGIKVSAIAAIGPNRELGKDGKIPWHIPEDFRHFKTITTGHPVIMGRKTFESIGKSLPNRTNIIITHNKDFRATDCLAVDTVEKAIETAKQYDEKEIFIIGGGEIYKQALPFVDKLYLTVIKGRFSADAFFPDYSDFKKIVKQEDFDDGQYQFSFLEIVK